MAVENRAVCRGNKQQWNEGRGPSEITHTYKKKGSWHKDKWRRMNSTTWLKNAKDYRNQAREGKGVKTLRSGQLERALERKVKEHTEPEEGKGGDTTKYYEGI